MQHTFPWHAVWTCAGSILAILSTGCGPHESVGIPDPGAAPGRVVLYTSLNEPTVRPVLDQFTARTGIRVELLADTERDKTVGLVRILLEERSRPRADVFWNSEIAHTVRLKHAGVLAPCNPPPPEADRIPSVYRDPEHFWFGFAARARVLIVNTDLVSVEQRPNSMWDLIDPRWRGQAALVRPVTGTTLTHMTALFEVLGEAETLRFLRGVVENDCSLPPGNGRLAHLVGAGEIAFGFTDTSDYRLVRHAGKPVVAVYPDQQGPDPLGTLLIPNVVSLVRGGPNPDNARRLLRFLLSDEAESILANHPRGHIPLRPGIEQPEEVRLPDTFQAMAVDFEAVGKAVEARLAELDALFP